MVYIHPEADYHPSTTIQKIIDAGMIPGLAINPGTSVETVTEILRIVVIGLGMIGLLLTELLCGAGYQQILAVGKRSFQRQAAQRLGISERNIYASVPDAQQNQDGFERWISDRTDGIGADIVFECVGRNETVVQAIDGAGPLGRVVLVGNPSADMQFSRDMYWKILRN